MTLKPHVTEQESSSSKERSRGGAIRVAALLVIPAAFYAPLLGGYFISESIGTILTLWEGPWFETLLDEFTGPCLQVGLAKFYRPVTTWLMSLEVFLFGSHAFFYHLVHLLAHLLNTLLVYRLAEKLFTKGDRIAPLGTALLFTLYPLHPNSIMKTSSYATVFSTPFFLIALWLFLRYRERGDKRSFVLCLASFAAAVCGYEGCAVLPLLCLALALFIPLPRDEGRPRGAWLPLCLSTFLVLALYMALRWAMLDEWISGHRGIYGRMAAWPPPILGDMIRSYYLLLHPSFRGWEWDPDPLVLGLVLLALLGLCLFFLYKGRGRTLGGIGLVALCWIAVTQAPFAFVMVLPANGRYWYLPSVGAALGIAVLCRAMANLIRFRPALVTTLLTLAAISGWAYLLVPNLGRYAEATRLSRTIQTRVLEEADRLDPDARIFVMQYPKFIMTPSGQPGAPVYNWCLGDALRPPFTDRTVALYPLPDLVPLQLVPLLREGKNAKAYLWDEDMERLEPIQLPPHTFDLARKLDRIEIIAPEDGAKLNLDAFREMGISMSGPGAEVCLIMSAPGRPWTEFLKLDPSKAPRYTLPVHTSWEVGSRYPEEVYWWLLTVDENREPLAVSPLRRLFLR